MKVLFKLVLILVLSTSSLVYASDTELPERNSINIVTFNTWLIPFLRKKHKTRGRLIGKKLRDFDIAILQEVFLPRDRGRIIKHLEKGGQDFDNRYETNAFLKLNPGLFNISKFKITKSSFLRFSDCLDEQCHVKKGTLHTRIRLNNNLEIDVYNAHLQPFKSGVGVRISQMKELVDFIARTNSGERPLILGGDFNTLVKSADILAPLERIGIEDAWAKINGNKGGYTWNSFVNIWSREIDGENYSQHRFDYLFFRGSEKFSVELNSAEIAFDEEYSYDGRSERMFLSDHFGVKMNISFEKR